MIAPLISYTQENLWPKEIVTSEGVKIVIYQPQPESLNGNKLEGRTAVSVKTKSAKDPVFGAIWFNGTLETDRTNRMASLRSLEVTDVRFPNNPDSSKIKLFSDVLESEIPKMDLKINLEELVATLEMEHPGNEKSNLIKTDPPKIIYEKTPSILILIDGEPKLQAIENMGVKRVVNTPFVILQDETNKTYYLNGNGLWYQSMDCIKDWKKTEALSPSISKIAEDLIKSGSIAHPDSVENTFIPKIIVSTQPAELIQTDGEIDMSPIKGTNLLYAKNSDDDIFLDIHSQSYFILITGRWYQSKTMEGTWTYVSSDKLPADFAKIPVGSEKDVVLANVAGTEQAIDAIHDAYVPQTATVNRETTTTSVTYDGDPKFEPVVGTKDLQYGVNTSSTVLKYKSDYYAVDNGIWFISSKPTGPWVVSTERPEQVEDIEPESPVYNVKYVYIYESTPEVVYVGYTPSYMGCYVVGPTVVYGTGYYYQPWYGAVYYPRPVTFGLSMHYNPWMGWSVGVSMSIGGPYGWMTIGFRPYPPYWGPHYGGFYGPHGHYPAAHHRVNHHYGNNNIIINNGNDRNNNYYNNRDRERINNGNVYNDRKGIQTNDVKGPNANDGRKKPSTMDKGANRQNNVYTDRQGNVYKGNSPDNMQRNNGGKWENPSNNKGPVKSDSPRPDNGAVNRDVQNRNTGTVNQRNGDVYRQQSGGYGGGSSRPSGGQMGGGRPAGGGARGGGGRR